VQRQFKIFRESKEREIQDVLQSKREVELQFQHYLSGVAQPEDENRSEMLGNGNMRVDWWAPSLESDASVDSLTQVTSFRGPEFFHSPLDREGPFTNISRGMYMYFVSVGMLDHLLMPRVFNRTRVDLLAGFSSVIDPQLFS